MHGFKGERTLMRIHIGERDKHQGKPLYQAIVELLRKRQYAGATVIRAIMGFGASARLHTDRLEILSLDLPIVVECIETEEKIEAILPELDRMIGGGLITLERARVILYRPELPEARRTDSWPIDATSWRTSGASHDVSAAHRLAHALVRSVRGPMWHGPALADAVEGLTAEQAAARPVPGGHSIWELVLHIAAWADIARERLAGARADPAPEQNFAAIGDPTEARWREAVARLEASYAALARAVESSDEATFAAPMPGRASPAWEMVQGVVEHGAYHGGQIALLRRALGIEPPRG